MMHNLLCVASSSLYWMNKAHKAKDESWFLATTLSVGPSVGLVFFSPHFYSFRSSHAGLTEKRNLRSSIPKHSSDS